MQSLLLALLVLVTTLSQAQAQSCSIVSSQEPYKIFASDSGVVYFTTRSNQLWRVQGTGTLLLHDFGPSSGSGHVPIYFISHWDGTKEVVLFCAFTATLGAELWTSDGTPAGTKLVKDTFPGWISGFPRDFTAMNGKIYFAAGGHLGRELWVTDGTPAGTNIVKNIAPVGSSNPQHLVVFKGRLYFSASDATIGGPGTELWVSDGTAAGTQMLADVLPGPAASVPTNLVVFGDFILFNAVSWANGDLTGFELHISDGTALGTRLLKDISPGTRNSYPYGMTPHGDHVYFAANHPSFGIELFRTDGTAAGTQLVVDLAPGVQGSGIRNLVSVGSKMFFSAAAQAPGLEPYVTDGTAAGTVLLKPLTTTPRFLDGPFVRAGGGVFALVGNELTFSDGTPAGTRTYCQGPASNPLLPTPIAVANGVVYFGGDISSRQLMRVDGNLGTIEQLSGGCGTEPATLSSEDPRIGKALAISGSDGSGHAGLLMIGALSSAQPLPGILAAHCQLRLDLASTIWMPQPASASWSITASVPNDPTLAGVSVGLQSVYGPHLFHTSPALGAVIGR